MKARDVTLVEIRNELNLLVELLISRVNQIQSRDSNRTVSVSEDNSEIAIAALRHAKLLENDGATLEGYYRRVVGVLGIQRARVRDLLESQRVLNEHLQNERSAISEIHIDDASMNLIQHHRTYREATRFLAVIDTLLETHRRA